MPRETKKQREEREALEQQAREQQDQAEYPKRLQTVLEACTEFGWSPTFTNGVVEVGGDYKSDACYFYFNYHPHTEYQLAVMENVIREKRNRIEEERRTKELRETVRSRLTDEE